jgi:hypothetical protein
MSQQSAPIYDDKAQVQGNLDLIDAAWQRPGNDGVEGGVPEIAFVRHTDGQTYVAMRNSEEPSGTVLVFTTEEWDSFLAAQEA